MVSIGIMKYLAVILGLFLSPINARYMPVINSDPQYFLNGKVIPEHYAIHLTTHVENCDKTCSFEGKVNITVLVNEAAVEKNEKVTQIELNSYPEIKISVCKLQGKNFV